MKLMEGKKGLIMGLANDKSIAWGIAKTLSDHGATIAISYQGEALKKRVEPLAETLNSTYLYECDVSKEESVQNLAKIIEADLGQIDFIVHSIAFADKNELRGYKEFRK
jgi:enoyl-[acyl-carrier protein] reductase I